MFKRILFWTFLLGLLGLFGSCSTQSFGPGLYGDAGITASTPDQNGYVAGFLRLTHDNLENEHITFDFGDILMDAGFSGEKIIDGSWNYRNTSKSEVAINYSYNGIYYSENYQVISPSSDHAYFILKLIKESDNTFEIYLDFFEAQ